jgi:hypothetical protein
MKKLLILPTLFIAATVFNIACENCKDYKDKYILTSSGDLAIKTPNGFLLNNGINSSDTLDIITRFKNECVTKVTSPSISFFNAAYAKCVGCGYEGNKNKLLNLKVTASSTFNGIAVDSIINSFVKVKWQNGYGVNNLSPLSTYIDTLLSPNFKDRFGCEIVMYPKPTTPFVGKIKITLQQQGAPDAIAETVNFSW